VAVITTVLAMRLSPAWGPVIAGLVLLPIVAWGSHAIGSGIADLHAVLTTALGAFRDRDFGLRLTVRGDHEAAELKRLYNELADAVRADRSDLQRKEALLDTILQRTPVAVLLLDQASRIAYANRAARDLVADGALLEGRLLEELGLAELFRAALAGDEDSLINHAGETFHLSQRRFALNTRAHRLVLIERLTPEIRRQEVALWKRAIRVITHELNNTIAPVSSLFHSARLAQDLPEHRHRLEEIHGKIEARLAHLRQFLEAYAAFARLPEPRKEPAAWSDVIDNVRALYPVRVTGTPTLVCRMDTAQMQQMLINLVKNAHESGSEPADVVIAVHRAGAECVVEVLDRGKGMTDSEVQQAVRPFYSTKPGGSGVGLAVCNEIVEAHGGRLHLVAREGGGTVVTAWIPGAL
jgi:two-component system, NtrC family, nitrogen regulation sensor histidine kinase NtrY